MREVVQLKFIGIIIVFPAKKAENTSSQRQKWRAQRCQTAAHQKKVEALKFIAAINSFEGEAVSR